LTLEPWSLAMSYSFRFAEVAQARDLTGVVCGANTLARTQVIAGSRVADRVGRRACTQL
jgi:hypothetical protein